MDFEPDTGPRLDGSAKVGKGRLLKLAGNVTATGTDDIGSCFFKSYDPVLRDAIHQLARSLGLAATLGTEHTGLVSAFPIVRPHGNRQVPADAGLHHVFRPFSEPDGEAAQFVAARVVKSKPITPKGPAMNHR